LEEDFKQTAIFAEPWPLLSAHPPMLAAFEHVNGIDMTQTHLSYFEFLIQGAATYWFLPFVKYQN